MFSIGQACKQIGLKIPTIRYYEEIGLVQLKSRSAGNQRRYSGYDLQRLSFIKHARELGFSIASVRQLLELSNSNADEGCVDIDQIAADQLLAVQDKMNKLQRLEGELQRMVDGCKSGEVEACYVIESLSNHDLCRSSH